MGRSLDRLGPGFGWRSPVDVGGVCSTRHVTVIEWPSSLNLRAGLGMGAVGGGSVTGDGIEADQQILRV